MEFLGIGPLELLFIVLIALIILGPQDMVKAGNTIGRLLRKTILSPTWLNIQRKVRTLPYELMREAGLEDLKDLRQDLSVDLSQQKLYPEEMKKAESRPAAVENIIPASEPIPAEWTSEPIISTPDTPPLAVPEIPDEWITSPVSTPPPEPADTTADASEAISGPGPDNETEQG